MRELNLQEAQQVNGRILAALGAFVAIFTLPLVLHDHKKKYGRIGADLSQRHWDDKHPYNPNSNGCYGPYC